jgi:hypothetical protein
MPFHAIAILSGNRQKTLPNKSEDEMLSQVVIPFVANGVVTANWGAKVQSYQVLELRIYETPAKWDKKAGPIADLLRYKRNLFPRFYAKAQKLLGANRPRIFVVTPIQGSEHGDQDQQRIYKEYNDRFEVVEKAVGMNGGVAIRIDRERPMGELVSRIKREIRDALFIVADLTDERPSCYFEVGFAEALGKPVVYIASQQSVSHPGSSTNIHFDIHANVQFFTNHKELLEKLNSTIEKNRETLFESAAATDASAIVKL